jgi:hypothetical protein
MTYYGYKRGDDSKIVDWSSVSSDITEKLGDVEAQRAAQREKLEGEMAAAQQSINDIPMGNYEDVNNFMLKFSNAAAEQMRVNNTLLRNGQMKPSEYTPFRQNVMDAAVSYKKIAENYNGMMDEFTLRQQENKAGELEAWQAGIVQDMADLSNTIPVIDPVTGKVFNAPIGADGKPDMKKAMAVRDMMNMAHQKYDRFDMEAQLNPIVDKYGRDIQVIKKGGVLTRSSILQRTFSSGGTSVLTAADAQKMAGMTYGDFRDPANQQWTTSMANKIRSMSGADALWAKTGKSGTINGQSDAELLAGFVESSTTNILTSKLGNTEETMSDIIDKTLLQYNDEQLASVLFDYNQTHKPTQDPTQRDADPEHFILIGKDGRLANRLAPELTDDQKELARATIKEQLLTKLDLVETPAPTTSGTAPSSAQTQAGKARDEAVASINTLADWYGAKTPKDRAVAAAGLGASLGTNFISLIPSPDGKTATLTSIQKVSGKDTQVENEIAIEGVPFDQFIKSFGKALTGQDLSQYYSDFVASGRTVNLAPIDPNTDYSAGAYKKTFKQPPKDLSQKLADVGEWRTNVVKTVDDIDVGTSTLGFGGQTDEEVNESFETAITENLLAAGISDYTVSRTDSNIKIKVDGLGEISVAVGRKDTDKAKVKKILIDVYTRVSKGEKIDGSGKPDGNKLLYPEWKKQNPNGTQKEYLSYFNS